MSALNSVTGISRQLLGHWDFNQLIPKREDGLGMRKKKVTHLAPNDRSYSRRDNRRIAGYVTVVATPKTGDKASQRVSHFGSFP